MRAKPKISAERMNFSIRLKEALASMRHLPPSATVLAREFNFRFAGKPITVHAARKWLVGDAIPTQDKLRSLALWLEVSVDWLRFGSQAQDLSTGMAGQLNPSPQDDMLRQFLSLPQRERRLAQDFIEMLVIKGRDRQDNRTVSSQKSVITDDVVDCANTAK